MKGDFSSLRFDARRNDQGLLYQQGRVTLDADLTAAELIELHWRSQAARDVIGAGIAAVPTGDSEGFKVESAKVVGSDVVIELDPGHVWADGLLLTLAADPAGSTTPVQRTVDYFPPPIDPAGTDVTSIGDGVRDAVVLEVALEELNAFQEPDRLIEPALGGPDTAERISARLRLGLVRLAAGEDCTTIGGRLSDPPAGLGRLSVSLAPPQLVPGDCPTVAGGGYTGFEHNLYRIEIADTADGVARFKWSQFNGALVGRGVFATGTPKTVTITANRAAIVSCGLTDFYLEALTYDDARGFWSVAYGAPATLNSDFDLELTDPPVFGTFSLGSDPVFFRLWNGIADVADYTNSANPVELRDGISLVFDPTASATYRPGDYWMFTVRAGEIANNDVLVDDALPLGPEYRRVPLAEIDWTAARDTTVGGAIEDCRRRFPPLTNQRTCCTIRVGDGVHTFGDFDSLEEAATHLPASGGELCLLPGLHYANLTLQNVVDVRITGCRHRTVVMPHQQTANQPIIHVVDSVGVEISGPDLISFFGPAIVAEGTEPGDLRDFAIRDCRILGRTFALRVNHGQDVEVAHNRCWILDTTDGRAAIQLRATDAIVERNALGVWPAENSPGGGGGEGGGTTTPTDPCADPGTLYADVDYALTYADYVWQGTTEPATQPYKGWGGIHLLGACEQIRVLQNRIEGGAGHGVTLGGLLPGDASSASGGDQGAPAPTVTLVANGLYGYVTDESGARVASLDVYLMSGGAVAAQGQSDANGLLEITADPGTYTIAVAPGHAVVSVSEAEYASISYFVIVVKEVPVQVPEEQAYLYDIAIDANEILRMALSGIGFRRFTDMPSPITAPDLSDPEAAATLLAEAFAPRELVGTCNVVRDLRVGHNRIHDNLQVVFDDTLRHAARTVGQGGISLALVENAVIAANEVLDNGVSAVDPVCGIFVGYGEDVEIRDNRIAGNGAITTDYETEKEEGLRGGIFVRFASALLLGGDADALQQPALRVTGNYVDQPAGRAITAFAFGPVSCLDNYLNSEHTGRWAVYDTLVGGVLILDIGGIQRQTSAAGDSRASVFSTFGDISGASASSSGGSGGAASSPTGAASYVAGTTQMSEQLLPGGEILYNSNQLRLGPSNKSAMAALVVTLDDLGFDGNQSTVLRPDLLLANVFCLACSLRATDNRFRERTKLCFFSLISIAYGLGSAAQLLTMNTTAHNQGDHCIVPLSNAPTPGGLPVVDDNNLEAERQCARLKKEPAMAIAMLYRGLEVVLLGQTAGTVGSGTTGSTTQATAVAAAKSVQGMAAQYRYNQAIEAARLRELRGPYDPRVATMKTQLARSDAGVRQLGIETQLASISAAAAPQGGTLVDGRITDAKASGRAGLTVELVKRDGTSLGVSTTTDASGHYALPLDAERTRALAAESGVYVQVKSASGDVLQRSDRSVALAAGTPVSASLVVPTRAVPLGVLAGGRVIFRQPQPSAGGAGGTQPPGGAPGAAGPGRAGGAPGRGPTRQ